MRLRFVRKLAVSRQAAALFAMIVTGFGVRDLSKGSGVIEERSTPWNVGRPLPIAVDSGLCRFTIPTPSRGSQTLLIVSSLARSPSTFPIRLTAKPIDPKWLEPPRSPVPERFATAAEPLRSPLPAIPKGATTTPPTDRVFHLMVRDGDPSSSSNYLAVNALLKSFGERVQIYVDADDLDQVDQKTLDDIVETFDAKVFPVAANTFGQARDLDGDGRFTVLMSSRLSRLGGGRLAVDGFVRGADLDAHLRAPFSNHADMMYLSTLLKAGPHLRTVIAHEYAHAVTFSAKTYPDGRSKSPGKVEEEGWLDEAIAHLVEDRHGFSRSNLDYRVSGFLSNPHAYRLVVDDYYAADLFRSPGNRGGTYLFLRWCADRFGADLIPKLIRSDMQGIANLEAAAGRPFETLYRDWTVALFMNGFEPKAKREGEFRSIDLRSSFDDWELAGPRTVQVSPRAAGTVASWSTAGTATRYLILEASTTGAVGIEIDAPAVAQLQVTAVPLPDDLGSLELGVTVVPIDGLDEKGGIVAVLRERNGTAVQLSSLAWEPAVPSADPHAPGFRHARLDRRQIAATFGRTEISEYGSVESKPIAANGALPRITPLIVKAVGTDAKGRRVSAWAELAPEGVDDAESNPVPSRFADGD